MKKHPVWILFIVSVLFFLIIPAGCGTSDVEKAKEFMAAGMYPQATELLKKRIQEKPDDADAHYNFGICLLNTGNFSKADERFASAVRLKSDYGFQIGGAYKQAGIESLKNSNISNATGLFAKAVEFQPDLKSEIAEFCMKEAEALIDKGKHQESIRCFEIAASHQPLLKNRIADRCMKEAESLLKGFTQNTDSSTSETVQNA